jgi:thiamine-phosphate pyrophosphorylase
MRTLEEYAKPLHAKAAAGFERMRYRAYTLEQRLVRWPDGPGRFEPVRLYVLLTGALCRRDPVETARAALAGGADCIQLREKACPPAGPGGGHWLGDRDLLNLARRLRELTTEAGALLIVNDRPDIAALAGADGVHLGQDDLPIAPARRLLPGRALIGRSTHSLEQARRAEAEGADYIGVGPMFSTATKDAGAAVGPGLLKEVAAAVSVPLVAIGGINLKNVSELLAAGCRRVAVCSAVIASDDPAAAAAELRSALEPS